MTVRVRFAPSPTGHVHIGNIRVAIFNWLFARHTGGRFLLRIEDTDLERSTPEAVRTLLAALDWLKLDHDEEPIYQSRTRPRHDAVVAQMIADGYASKAGPAAPTLLHLDARLFSPTFVTEPQSPVTLDVSRAEVRASRTGLTLETRSSKGEPFLESLRWDALAELQLLGVDGAVHRGETVRERCMGLTDPTGPAASAEGVRVEELLGVRPATLSFLRRFVYYDDLVLGRREKPLDSMHDLVVVRSDGSPVFHLANVVDDVDMGITHVLRGNDHVENTFRHLFIYAAMGARPPRFGHLPMIVNAAGKPYSKRDGDAYVGDFQRKGILPECLFNFLALCGWSPGDDREIMTRAEMVEAFTIERIGQNPAQFGLDKLAWMNRQYLAALPVPELAGLIRGQLGDAGIEVDRYADAWWHRLTELLVPRLTSLPEVVAQTSYFFSELVTVDEAARQKVLLKDQAAGLQVLALLRERLAALPAWTEEALKAALEQLATDRQLKLGAVAQPLRVATTGSTASPSIWETVFLIGRDRTLRRIDQVLAGPGGV